MMPRSSLVRSLTPTFVRSLAAALAFGLGGRDVAGRMLQDAYDKGREQKGQVEDDIALGKERAS